jgi:hypothetical protein
MSNRAAVCQREANGVEACKTWHKAWLPGRVGAMVS